MQAHPKRPSSHPRPLLQKMVRLLGLSQRDVRPHLKEITRDGVRVQEVHESVQEGHTGL